MKRERERERERYGKLIVSESEEFVRYLKRGGERGSCGTSAGGKSSKRNRKGSRTRFKSVKEGERVCFGPWKLQSNMQWTEDCLEKSKY